LIRMRRASLPVGWEPPTGRILDTRLPARPSRWAKTRSVQSPKESKPVSRRSSWKPRRTLHRFWRYSASWERCSARCGRNDPAPAQSVGCQSLSPSMSVTPSTLARSAQAGTWSWTRKFSVRSFAFGLTIVVVSYLVLVPLILLLYASVRSTEDKLPFESTVTTLSNYTAVLTNPSTLPIFLNTFLFTAGSLAVGLPLAVFMAWLLERTAIPARRWIATLILVPMTLPSLLSAIALIQLLDPRIGLINVVLRSVLGLSGDTGPFDIYTLYGMCFVQGLRLVPSAYLMIAASFRAMDPSLEEQSAMAGRGVTQT